MLKELKDANSTAIIKNFTDTLNEDNQVNIGESCMYILIINNKQLFPISAVSAARMSTNLTSGIS